MDTFFTFHMPVSVCPQCGAVQDYATPPRGGGPPEPGDVSICADCGAVRVFDEQLRLQNPTPTQQVILEMDPDVRQAQAFFRARHRQGVPE